MISGGVSIKLLALVRLNGSDFREIFLCNLWSDLFIFLYLGHFFKIKEPADYKDKRKKAKKEKENVEPTLQRVVPSPGRLFIWVHIGLPIDASLLDVTY